jgi:hypothetical protein
MKSQLERDFDRSFKPQPRKHCEVCGSTEPLGADGQPTRYISLGDGKWACNYCNNQRPGA